MSDFASEYHSVKVDSATDVVYNQYLAINNELWNKTDSLVFDLPMVESPADLEVNISVRYTNRYPYQNLQISTRPTSSTACPSARTTAASTPLSNAKTL